MVKLNHQSIGNVLLLQTSKYFLLQNMQCCIELLRISGITNLKNTDSIYETYWSVIVGLMKPKSRHLIPSLPPDLIDIGSLPSSDYFNNLPEVVWRCYGELCQCPELWQQQ